MMAIAVVDDDSFDKVPAGSQTQVNAVGVDGVEHISTDFCEATRVGYSLLGCRPRPHHCRYETLVTAG